MKPIAAFAASLLLMTLAAGCATDPKVIEAHGKWQTAFEQARKPLYVIEGVGKIEAAPGKEIRIVAYQTRRQFFKDYRDARLEAAVKLGGQATTMLTGLGGFFFGVEGIKALKDFGSPATPPAQVTVSGQGSAVVGSGTVSGSPPSGPTSTTTTTTNPGP